MQLNGKLGANDVRDENVHASYPLGPTKYQPTYLVTTNLGFAIGATPTTRTEIVHRVAVAGSLRSFVAGLVTDGSSTSITFDLQKNGVSVLAAVVTVTSSTGDGVGVAGTINTSAVAAGDLLSVVMTVSSSTGAAGPFVSVGLSEGTAP